MDFRAIKDAACEQTELSDFGSYNDLDHWWSLISEELAESEQAASMLEYRALMALKHRLYVADGAKVSRHLRQAPVMVVGVPRTGTSYLYDLLSLSVDLRALTGTEARWGAKLNGYTEAEARTWYDISDRFIPEMRDIHPRAADRPEELHWATEATFQSIAFPIQFPMWVYQRELEAESMWGPLRFAKDLLMSLDSSARWLLKEPADLTHAMDYDDVFPNVRIIWIHRDPAESVPSLCSLIDTTHRATSGVKTPDLGLKILTKTVTDLQNGWQLARRIPNRVMHVEYEDLVSNPYRTVSECCRWLQAVAPQPDKIEQHLANFPKPQHDYFMDDYGLSPDLIYGVLNGLR